ncbi:type II toxin-antitoxin system RelE/ParE family toxin [Devosia sp.]|uniref:type II toxin-antitoxin system RelE/ParE family toxin n=1 Tax=Devosia sp. TaxID=1871048 RepID=UPI003F71DDB7
MLPIVWSTKALDDLDGIVAFIATRDFTAAGRLHERIEQSVLPTASHPYMFRSGRVNGTREIVAHPNYVIVYRVLADMILVTAVVHARQEYP